MIVEEPSPCADAGRDKKLTGMAELTVACEDVPLLGEILLVDEVAEPAEGALFVDRPLQPFPQDSVVLPLGEGRHIAPTVPRASTVELGPTVGLLQRAVRPDAQHFHPVDLFVADQTPVSPVVAEVKDELELRTRTYRPRDLSRLNVERRHDRPTDPLGHLGSGLLVGDHTAVGKGGHRQV